MDLELIERLLEIVAESGMAEVEVEQDDFKVVVRAHPTTAPSAVPAYAVAPPVAAPLQPVDEAAVPVAVGGDGAAAQSAGTIVPAPIVGTYYSAPAPDSDPFVMVGERVEVGHVLCIIEAMKLMNEIKSEHAGVIKQILVENAQPVEYDQPLFIIEEA